MKNKTLAAATLLLTLVVTGFAVASKPNRSEEAQASRVQANELPREWVWQKKAVNFDDMVRRKSS